MLEIFQSVPVLGFLSVTVTAFIALFRGSRIGKEFLPDILDEHFSESEAERQFQTLVDWGRNAQLFEYDADEERLYKVHAEEPENPSD